MACTAIPSLLFCLLLLAPHLGSSYHTSYTHAGKHVVLRSSDGPSAPTTFCSAIPSGDGGGLARPLPVMHRLSPCSPLGAAAPGNQGNPSVGDVLHRDALRLRALFGEDSASYVTIPTTGTPFATPPGASDYHVVVGYGTPAQKFPVEFDTITRGVTLLSCKPCSAGEPCDQSFDPSQSSSLAQIPCGSPDCPLSACSGPSCVVSETKKGTLLNTTVVTDTLTLSPSATVENFRFACLEMGASRTLDNSSGVLDLSRNSHSLASRVPSSPFTVAFSYCLPSGPATQGFLSIGVVRPELSGHRVSYANLSSNAAHPSLYFVHLAGIGVGGPDIPIPPARLAGDSVFSLGITFTYLRSDLYAVLRNEFNKQMTEYRRAPPQGNLDTCYDFTGLNSITIPVIRLKLEGGASLGLDIVQMLYYKDPGNLFSVACLAFAPIPAYGYGVESVPPVIIGTLAQTNTEVVYDVRGGKVGLIPDRC